MENKYEIWEPTPLKEWSDSNHLYLTEKELKNVEKHLVELSKYNYKRNAEESWREYADEDKVLYVTPTKQNIVATEEDFDENNRYIGESGPNAVIEISEDVLGALGNDLSGMFEGVEAKIIKFT